MADLSWRQRWGVKPRSPKGRAPARGLDAHLCLQHPFTRAKEASSNIQPKDSLDHNHGIYGDYMSGGTVKPDFWALFTFIHSFVRPEEPILSSRP
jgi:hypothetical protein